MLNPYHVTIPQKRIYESLIYRKKISIDVMKNNMEIWNDTLQRNDSHSFWEHVDWKGNFKCKRQIISPSIEKFENFFEDLFTTDSNEVEEIMDLESECYIPVLDDPITERELNYAWKDMKKAGYDYSLPVIGILVTHFTLMVVTILNLLFYVQYPVSFACSMLSTIPYITNNY